MKKKKTFENKVCWVTGASSGIGEQLARLLMARGARLVLSGRNEAALKALAAEYPQAESMVLTFDLEHLDDAGALVARVQQRFGRIDYLINNGGVSQRSSVVDTPLEIDRKLMEINFFGNIALAKAVLPVMIAQGGGHISVTSSLVGKFGFPLRSAYSASKQALHGFYESLRAENHHHHIRVLMIIPGRINTRVSVNALTASGEKHGVMDPGQARGLSAQRAARKILRAMQRGKKEVLVGKMDILMVYFRRFFPALFYYLATKVNPR